MLRLQLPFTIADPRSPYYMILLKTLDVLTTWMFLSQGLSEGNLLARDVISMYGVFNAGLFAMFTMLIYCLFIQELWRRVDHWLLRWVCNLSFNVGVVLNLLVPLWNFGNMYLHYAMS